MGRWVPAAMTASHSLGLAGNFFDVAPDFMFFGLSQADDVLLIAALRAGHDLTPAPASAPLVSLLSLGANQVRL